MQGIPSSHLASYPQHIQQSQQQQQQQQFNHHHDPYYYPSLSSSLLASSSMSNMAATKTSLTSSISPQSATAASIQSLPPRNLEIKQKSEVPQLIVSEIVRQFLYHLDIQLRYHSLPVMVVNDVLQWNNFPKAVRAFLSIPRIKAVIKILVETRKDMDQHPDIKAALLTINPFSHDIRNAMADTHSLKRKLEVILPEFPVLKSVQSSKKKQQNKKLLGNHRFPLPATLGPLSPSSLQYPPSQASIAASNMPMMPLESFMYPSFHNIPNAGVQTHTTANTGPFQNYAFPNQSSLPQQGHQMFPMAMHNSITNPSSYASHPNANLYSNTPSTLVSNMTRNTIAQGQHGHTSNNTNANMNFSTQAEVPPMYWNQYIH